MAQIQHNYTYTIQIPLVQCAWWGDGNTKTNTNMNINTTQIHIHNTNTFGAVCMVKWHKYKYKYTYAIQIPLVQCAWWGDGDHRRFRSPSQRGGEGSTRTPSLSCVTSMSGWVWQKFNFPPVQIVGNTFLVEALHWGKIPETQKTIHEPVQDVAKEEEGQVEN